MSDQTPTCGFDGNPDLYGLGIRMGVYFQWVSALAIWRWYPQGRTELGGAYLVFLFALLVAMIVITARVDPTHAAEILILMYIIFGGVFTVMMIGLRKSHTKKVKNMQSSWVQVMVLFFILAAASIYCSWFWLSGIHHDFLETDCGTYGFLFTKVSLKNEHVTKFFAALSVYLAILYVIASIYAIGAFAAFLVRAPWLDYIIRKHEQEASIAGNRGQPSSSGKRPPRNQQDIFTSVIAPTANVVSLVYSVIGIEMTLQWNHVTGVYSINSVGQLIPFVIGLAGFVKVIYEPLKEHNLSMRKTKLITGDGADFGNEGVAVSEQKQGKECGDVEYEAATANRRLGYLDLIKPVEEVTVREWREDGFKK